MRGQDAGMDFKIYNRYLCVGTVEAWRLTWALTCNHKYMPVETHMSKAKEIAPFWRIESPFYRVLRNAGLSLTARNPSTTRLS